MAKKKVVIQEVTPLEGAIQVPVVPVDKNWQEVLAKIEKDFGKGSIIRASDKPKHDVPVIPTGSLGLDEATGIFGYPKGRVIEIIGPESAGKTTLCIEALVQAQKLEPDKECAFIDMEHALDTYYAESLGLNMDKLLLSQPDYGEQALGIVRRLILSEKVSMIVVDSVASLVPKGELDGEIGDSKLGLQARLMSQSMRVLVGAVEKTGTILIFTNQIREKIGVQYGSPETTPGGRALKFYASMRLDIRKQQTNKDGEESISNTVKVKMIKNKMAPPFKEAIFNIEYGTGIDKNREIITRADQLNIIQRSGSWYSYGESKIGQGIDQVIQLFHDNEDLKTEILNKILNYKPE